MSKQAQKAEPLSFRNSQLLGVQGGLLVAVCPTFCLRPLAAGRNETKFPLAVPPMQECREEAPRPPGSPNHKQPWARKVMGSDKDSLIKDTGP